MEKKKQKMAFGDWQAASTVYFLNIFNFSSVNCFDSRACQWSCEGGSSASADVMEQPGVSRQLQGGRASGVRGQSQSQAATVRLPHVLLWMK